MEHQMDEVMNDDYWMVRFFRCSCGQMVEIQVEDVHFNDYHAEAYYGTCKFCGRVYEEDEILSKDWE